MSSTNPHIILVPGAWHTGACYDLVIPLLQDAGYATTALTLPSVGAEPPVTSMDQDAAVVHSAVSDLVDAGRDVVVVMHSYSAVPGSDGVKGLSKRERAGQGLDGRGAGGAGGGVVALVYLCEWMLPEGKAITDYPRPPAVLARMRFEDTYVYHIDPVAAFYGDLAPEEAEKRKAAIKHHSAATLRTPLKYAAYKHIPTTYLLCTNDQQLPYERQKELVGSAGVEIATVTCDSSHSPFLSQPKLVVEVIRKAAGERL